MIVEPESHGVEKEIKFKEDISPPKFVKKLREQNSWHDVHFGFDECSIC